MSVQTALDNIWLRPSSRWGHTEYSLSYHTPYLVKRTGLPADSPDLLRTAQDLLAFDFNWSTNNGLVEWEQAGRTTDMGHAEYAADGSDYRLPSPSPFHSEEEVWAFDPIQEYGLPDRDEQIRAYEESIRRARQAYPEQLTTGGYYRTIVSGAIAAFGWEMFLAAAADPAKIEQVFDGFFRWTLFHMQAWAQTTVEVVIQHDDFVWAGGPFMQPAIYRQMIIPRYAELWKPIHAAGKKVLFCSDGDFTAFVGDLANAGADGFIFEPFIDFGFMADSFGQTKCLVGSFVDCRDLTFSNWDEVRRGVDKTIARLSGCKGAIVAVGNHLPPNIPEAMLDRYFDYLLPRLAR